MDNTQSTESALDRMRRLERQVNGQLAALDIDIIGRETGKTIIVIRRLLGDARLDIRDYEMSDSRADMEKNAKAARKRLDQLRAALLKISEHGILSSIDVTVVSVEIDLIKEEL